MNDLYPAIEPYKSQRIAIDHHHLYIEEVGNPAGIPALFLHGGPGAGCEPYHRQFFDPELYRVVLFDQRGSGRSTPH
ncbi:MAG: prolyl aminopeptidase, partial [Candidatus Thiodiazotropha lotti]